MSDKLYQPFRLGRIDLSNRIVMAPLTRNRAGAGNVPNELMAEYYGQRAGAGLIIAEATHVMPEGQGYLDTPGIHSPDQVAGWKRVTDAVHAKGGRIFLQMWHVGRVSHSSLLPGGMAPVAPSALRANTKTYIQGGFADVSQPRALEAAEIPAIVQAFADGARNAIAAGFDGVEVHGANGYLVEQFLKDGANQRTDAYGGSIANRVRFLVEVMEAVIGAIGADRTGVRLSPVTPANDISDSNPTALYAQVMAELERLQPVYVHVVEGATGGPRDIDPNFDFAALRRAFSGVYMANNGYDAAMAAQAVDDGAADLVAFGKPFISNPDLVERLRRAAPLNALDQASLYGGGAKGYIDYPALVA